MSSKLKSHALTGMLGFGASTGLQWHKGSGTMQCDGTCWQCDQYTAMVRWYMCPVRLVHCRYHCTTLLYHCTCVLYHCTSLTVPKKTFRKYCFFCFGFLLPDIGTVDAPMQPHHCTTQSRHCTTQSHQSTTVTPLCRTGAPPTHQHTCHHAALLYSQALHASAPPQPQHVMSLKKPYVSWFLGLVKFNGSLWLRLVSKSFSGSGFIMVATMGLSSREWNRAS